MEETVFGVLFFATIIYVILGNYLYFTKILPTLDEPPKFLPSAQLNDVERFLQILDKRGEDRWFAPILRHVRTIGIALLIGYAAFVALLVFG